MYTRKTKRPKLTEDIKILTIKFFNKHGLANTIDCFFETFNCSISKSTIYSWKNEYDRNHDHGALHTSLAHKNNEPKRFRVSETDPRISEEIIKLRHKYPILGKAKLYHILIPFCQANGIKLVSISTIEKIIRKLKLIRSIPTCKTNYDVNINGKSSKLEIREIRAKMRKKKNRKPKGE